MGATMTMGTIDERVGDDGGTVSRTGLPEGPLSVDLDQYEVSRIRALALPHAQVEAY